MKKISSLRTVNDIVIAPP